MKLFPEQNGNLMNSLHNPSSLQPTTLQQAAAIIPTLTNNSSMESVSNVNNPNVSSAALNSLMVNNSSNYPLEMECDPVSSASLPSSSSLSTTSNATTNPTLLNSRYNFLLSGLNASASSGALLNGVVNPTANAILGGSIGGGGSLSGNHAHLHRNSKSASNVLQNFAPTSLPIGLYSGLSNNGGGGGVVNNDTHSLAAYQHHLLSSGVAPNGNIAYIPYSMSSNETVPKTNSTMTSSSSLSSS